MISLQNNIFHLYTRNTSYVFRITKTGHSEHIYYGKKLNELPLDITALFPKYSSNSSSFDLSIDKDHEDIVLNNMALEFSTEGKGDFKTPLVSSMNKKTLDFRYKSHKALHGISRIKTNLFQALGSDQDVMSLEVVFEDKNEKLTLTTIYSVFYQSDTITRRVVIQNKSNEKITLKNAYSVQLDLPSSDYSLITLSSTPVSERNEIERDISYGKLLIESKSNISSLNHNPAIIIRNKNCNDCYLINLIYSGSHQEVIECEMDGSLHILSGINSDLVNFTLDKNGEYESPEAVLTFSSTGLNTLSRQSHSFINNHILRGLWKNKQRPVIKHTRRSIGKVFTEKEIEKDIRESRKLGFDLYCLSDGWFGVRNDDLSSLGDWSVNTDKLPSGLKNLSTLTHSEDMMFGLWFEIECISENSRLYKKHPTWVTMDKKRDSSYEKNEYILDITKDEVQDYLIDQIRYYYDEIKVDYIKWDFNRKYSDIVVKNGEDYHHRYILSLNKMLKRISITCPKLLIEMGSFGGARFDLGLLCYSQLLTLSDSYNCLSLASNIASTSLVYPQNTFSATISDDFKFRKTSLDKAFDILSFSSISYDVNAANLSLEDKLTIKEQIAFYKQYRAILQFGSLSRVKDSRSITLSKDNGDSSIILSTIIDQYDSHNDYLKIESARSNELYDVIRRMGVNLDLKSKNGEYYQATGSLLKSHGIRLINELNSLNQDEKDCQIVSLNARQYITKKVSK